MLRHTSGLPRAPFSHDRGAAARSKHATAWATPSLGIFASLPLAPAAFRLAPLAFWPPVVSSSSDSATSPLPAAASSSFVSFSSSAASSPVPHDPCSARP
jgi:hypothetical protein